MTTHLKDGRVNLRGQVVGVVVTARVITHIRDDRWLVEVTSGERLIVHEWQIQVVIPEKQT